jgi:Polyketide cyclase / dehydrase and lipid transport
MADTQVDVTRRIAAPASTIWRLVSDVTRMGDWSPETTAATWSKGANGPTLGARFSGKNRNGRKTWSTVCTVDECEPDRTFGFAVVAGPLKVAHWSYRIGLHGHRDVDRPAGLAGAQARQAVERGRRPGLAQPGGHGAHARAARRCGGGRCRLTRRYRRGP